MVPSESDGVLAKDRRAVEILRDLGLQAPPGQATAVFDASVDASDGFEMTAEDDAEWKRPLQSVGYFLIGTTV